MYMYALSRGETNIIEIIRSVAKCRMLREISKEFAMIMRDMELLGIDFMSAFECPERTPSENLNQFLGNLITLIDNGGEVSEFFSVQIGIPDKDKSDHSLFLDMLGMIAEVMSPVCCRSSLHDHRCSHACSMKGSMTWLLMGLTYAVLPFGSIGFVFLIDLMLPKDEQIISSLNLQKVKGFVGIRMIKEA